MVRPERTSQAAALSTREASDASDEFLTPRWLSFPLKAAEEGGRGEHESLLWILVGL